MTVEESLSHFLVSENMIESAHSSLRFHHRRATVVSDFERLDRIEISPLLIAFLRKRHWFGTTVFLDQLMIKDTIDSPLIIVKMEQVKSFLNCDDRA